MVPNNFLKRLAVLVSVFCASVNSLVPLCALDKYDNKCICEYHKFDEDHFPRLTANCKWIELKTFPNMKQFSQDLVDLDLTHNEIASLEGESSSESLVSLNLAYNNIDRIENSFFDNFPNLEKLTLSHNQISKLQTDAFDGLNSLKYLDLSFNKLTTLPDDVFAKLTNLKELNLGYNQIGKFLEESKCIFKSSIALPRNLTYLNLDRVGLDVTPSNFFDGGEDLKTLSIADNSFDEIPAIPNSVVHFDFSGNNVTLLNVRHLNYHNIKTLKLNRMLSLQTIENYAFYNMQNLEELYLENCPRLRELNSLAFGVINPTEYLSLKRLSLARSGLQRLNSTYFHLFKNMEYVNLQNNPWVCDCQILWIQLLNGSIEKPENVRCMSPTNLRNLKIMDIQEKHLPSCLMSSKNIQLQKILIPILGVAVILLLCLITYLIYMGPYLYRNYRGIGPESPYQHTVLREYNS